MGYKPKRNRAARSGESFRWGAYLILFVGPGICLYLMYLAITKVHYPVGYATWATLSPLALLGGYWNWLQSQPMERAYRLPLLLVVFLPLALGGATYLFTFFTKWGSETATGAGITALLILALCWNWHFRYYGD